MKQVKKILFPIDFAANFDTLLPWVSTFAEKFDATLYVLFVAQDLSHFATFYVPHGNIQGFQEQAIDSARKRMAAAVEEFSRISPSWKPGSEWAHRRKRSWRWPRKKKSI